ncbi:MAG TPA: FAD-dependent monooxygenase [Thermomicrobiales bacterium]|nr:FAD-dependent monooxygenase [Thermomicrobiales bacterium]
MTSSRQQSDTLVVGAGPTGLTLAIELARRGVPFRIIDRETERTKTSRAIGTQARTVEVFRLMGIPESALEPAARPRALRFAERDRTLARITFGDGPPGAPRLISMDESDTERVLEQRLEQLGGRVDRSTQLLGFRFDGERVTATLQGPNGTSELETRFLVGADGAHSTVRRGAGIAFVGDAYPERFLLADLDLDWDLPHDEGHIWIGDDGLVAAIPLPGERRYRVIVPLPPAYGGKEYESEAEIAAEAETLLGQRTGVPLRRVGDPVWASAFRIQRRQADRYRWGPVFLAGDAAHVHSPVGGQGMNTGIQDAFNLGWKLALAARDQAAPGLLDTYQAERHPIARGVLRGTHLGTRLFLAQNSLMRAVREYVVPAIVDIPPVRHRILGAVSQLTINYRGSPLSVDADNREEGRRWLHRNARGPRAGDRVPDATLIDACGSTPVALFDLISQGWVLLIFPGDEVREETAGALDRVSRQISEAVGDAVHTYLVLDTPGSGGATGTMLLDPSRKIADVFGARQGLVALMRPDGYLGYRGRLDQSGELASYLARVFAMRLREAEVGPLRAPNPEASATVIDVP